MAQCKNHKYMDSGFVLLMAMHGDAGQTLYQNNNFIVIVLLIYLLCERPY